MCDIIVAKQTTNNLNLGISLSLFLSVFCAACQCFEPLFSVLNTFKIFKTTTCFGLNWPSSSITSINT
jgi:hypothetical protein